jgi:hypothetical protein
VPLELWDLWIGDRILWAVMPEPDFPELLLEALRTLHGGGGATRSEGPAPVDIRGFEALFIGGGAAENGALRKVFLNAPWPVVFSDEGCFVGEKGGFHLLAMHGRPGLVVDLGQTQLKVAGPGWRRTFPRDFTRLPMRGETTSERKSEQRIELRRFIGESLRECAAGMSVEGLVIALPSRLDDQGVPEGSSYEGMAGDAALVKDALEIAGLRHAVTWLLNDAELASLGARLHPGVDPRKRTLVLTLGFGLGAALLLPCSP